MKAAVIGGAVALSGMTFGVGGVVFLGVAAVGMTALQEAYDYSQGKKITAGKVVGDLFNNAYNLSALEILLSNPYTASGVAAVSTYGAVTSAGELARMVKSGNATPTELADKAMETTVYAAGAVAPFAARTNLASMRSLTSRSYAPRSKKNCRNVGFKPFDLGGVGQKEPPGT